MLRNDCYNSEAANQDEHGVQDAGVLDSSNLKRKRLRTSDLSGLVSEVNAPVTTATTTADLTGAVCPDVSKAINGESKQHSDNEPTATTHNTGTARKRKRRTLSAHRHEGDGGRPTLTHASAADAQHGDGALIDGNHHDVSSSAPVATNVQWGEWSVAEESNSLELEVSAPQANAETAAVVGKRQTREPHAECSSGAKRVRFAESKQLEVKVPHQPSASKAEIPDDLFSSTPGGAGGSSSRMHASQAWVAEPLGVAAIALSVADELPEAVQTSLSMQRARELSLARLAATPVSMSSVPSAPSVDQRSHQPMGMWYPLDGSVDIGDPFPGHTAVSLSQPRDMDTEMFRLGSMSLIGEHGVHDSWPEVDAGRRWVRPHDRSHNAWDADTGTARMGAHDDMHGWGRRAIHRPRTCFGSRRARVQPPVSRLDRLVRIAGPLPDWLTESSSRPHVPGSRSGIPLTNEPELESQDPYIQWGGLLSALSDTTDGMSALSSGHQLHHLRALVDQLDISSIHSFRDWCDRMASVSFTEDDVNYINSPLLDGLYAAYHGRRITDSASQLSSSTRTDTVSAPPNLRTALIRASSLTSTLASDAFRFLVRLNEARELSATDYNAVLEAVCDAYRPGHALHGAQVVLDASTYALPVLERCLVSACTFGCLGLFKLLLKVAVSSHGAQRLLRTVEAAAVEGRSEFFLAVLQAGAVTYRALSAAVCAALRRDDQAQSEYLWSLCSALVALSSVEDLLVAASASSCQGILQPMLEAVKSSVTTPIMDRCIDASITREREANVRQLLKFCTDFKMDFHVDSAAKIAARCSCLAIADLMLSQCMQNVHNHASVGDFLFATAVIGGQLITRFLARRMYEQGLYEQYAGALTKAIRESNHTAFRSLLLNHHAVVHMLKARYMDVLQTTFSLCTGQEAVSKVELLGELLLYFDEHGVAVDWVAGLRAAVKCDCGSVVKTLLSGGRVQQEHATRALIWAIQSRSWIAVGELTKWFARNKSHKMVIVKQAMRLSASSLTELLQAVADCLPIWPELARALFEHGMQSGSEALAEAICSRWAVVQQLTPEHVLSTAHAILLKQPRAVELLLSSYAHTPYMVPCHSLNELLMRAVRDSAAGVVRAVVEMQVDLHTNDNAPLRTACAASDWPCLDALLHGRHQPHSIVAPSTAASSCDMFAPLEMVPCNCTLMSGPRYMTELLWADAGHVGHRPSSRIIPSIVPQVTLCACIVTGCESGAMQSTCAASTPSMGSGSAPICQSQELDEYLLTMIDRKNWLAVELCLRDSTGHLHPLTQNALPELMTLIASVARDDFIAFKAHVMRLEAAQLVIQQTDQAQLTAVALQRPSDHELHPHRIAAGPLEFTPDIPASLADAESPSKAIVSNPLQFQGVGYDNGILPRFDEPMGLSLSYGDPFSTSMIMDIRGSPEVPMLASGSTSDLTHPPVSLLQGGGDMSVLNLSPPGAPGVQSVWSTATEPVVSPAVEPVLPARNHDQSSTGSDSEFMQPLPLGKRVDIVISARGNLTLARRS